MYQLHTEKQRLYFNEVIRLHYEEGYGEDRIEKVLPIGHTTASRWIAIFAKERGKISEANNMTQPHANSPSQDKSKEVEELHKRAKDLEARLLQAEIKVEFYDKMINVAEAKFKLPIRKKADAKQ